MRARPHKKQTSKKAMTGSFRVIAGKWRSRRLSFPAVEGLRPTTDRVRETVFNWLASDIDGARVLDVFAGSGSLGIEALSRGADSVTFIERDRSAAQALRENLSLLQGNGEVVQNDALEWLKSGLLASSPVQYDLILLDPPFRKGLLDDCLELLSQSEIIKTGTLIYLELEKERNDLPLPPDWRRLKEKVAGQVSYCLYEV